MELWTADDSIFHPDEGSPEVRILREARYIVSGIVYGWDFSYTPSDAQRRVSERFQLQPTGEIPWGAPGLRVRDLKDAGGILYGQIDYTFSSEEEALLRTWGSFREARSSGAGSASIEDGTDGKLRSMEKAIHEAVRSYLRGRLPNRPREVTGAVALAGPPRVRIVAGEYEARLTVVIEIRNILQYLNF